MSEHELEKLLGGFAADTLTSEERRQLFTAALHDQQLFDALADEQALKELLTDPAVRRRLLDALNQASSPPRISSVPWLDWLRRPANLALAGGLATAAFAIILGTKIYQDGLKQSAPFIATEESRPASPPAPTEPASSSGLSASPESAEPQPKAKENALPTTQSADTAQSADKDAAADRIMKREKSRPSKPDERETSAPGSDPAKQRAEQDSSGPQARQSAITPDAVDALKASPDLDLKRRQTSEPPAAAPKSLAPTQGPSAGSALGNVAPTAGARALFYGDEPARIDQGIGKPEQQQSAKSMREGEGQRPLRSAPKTERFAAAAAPQFKPLGLRYGFAIRTDDGTAQETDAATALKSGDQARLTIEVNQDAFVQIWKTAGSSAPQLWFPMKETGQISAQVPAGRRQGIPLSQENEPYTLTVRLARVPFGPIMDQEPVTLAVPSNQLQETVTPDDPTGSQEQATYVVNTNPSPTVQLIAEILIGSSGD
ncbi:MAG TPA: hypothetical protein VJ746_07130 [Nitrospira sp.]|nr:hypothetical protein [Nitrospira sp.]